MRQCAGVAQLVEHHVANVVVVGSNPITRSWLLLGGQAPETAVPCWSVGTQFGAGPFFCRRSPVQFRLRISNNPFHLRPNHGRYSNQRRAGI